MLLQEGSDVKMWNVVSETFNIDIVVHGTCVYENACHPSEFHFHHVTFAHSDALSPAALFGIPRPLRQIQCHNELGGVALVHRVGVKGKVAGWDVPAAGDTT